MAKDPAVLFYTSDFLAGTILFSLEELGAYIKLLCLQREQGHLPMAVIEEVCGRPMPKVFAKFEADEHGLYYQHRMEEEIIKRNKYSESRRQNASNPKRTKEETNDTEHMPSICLPYDNHMGNRNRNSNSNKNSNRDINIPSIDNSDSNSSNKYLDRFTDFWQIYPKKTGKEAAKREFLRIKPSQELTDRMIEKIKELCQSDQWRREGGKFIPNPSTWLHQGRWDDETSISLYREAKKTADEPLPF
jgi:uncharacterized protein YdaU (DUF1376 family)